MRKVIPDGFLHSKGNGLFNSHETICILNMNDSAIEVELILYFENRDKIEGFHYTIESERSMHIRLDHAVNNNGQEIPRDTPYSICIELSDNAYIQYSRMDTSQSNLSIATTII